MGLNLAALNSEFNSNFVPKTISDFLLDLSAIHDYSDKIQKLNDFVHKLEDEIKKIQVFQRELPLSMLLLRDAIAKLKEETMRCEERIKGKLDEDKGVKVSIDNNDKKNWMSSVQLWTNAQEDDDSPAADSMSDKTNRAGDLVLPIRQENQVLGKIGENSSRKIEIQKNQRKQRRCWSPELHRRFISALHQLGGPQVATPKQIRELMQVQDLTNDEIKSHLQKYRLHVRKVVPDDKSGATSDSSSWLGKNKLFPNVSNPKTTQSLSPDGPVHNTSGSSANRGVSLSVGDREYESMARISSASQSH